ncbi:hypothetical protein [Bailinhaonella thermotolerans]|uniref:hypothetical protein n=1 Tax=Bailinhaonella thermotolerans TaxID=1070861 RepID=UPI00192A550D|nr:hypothetical protein [Bailinhaonella thermotolerans]
MRFERDGERAPRVDREPRERLPEVPVDIRPEDLDKEIRAELRSLPNDLADLVSLHLVAAERILPEDAEAAYEHAKAARRFASRIGIVREAAGMAAYRAGHWAEALSDLRAARRMMGTDAFLPVIADCERGMGRPERALDLARSPEAERLDRAGRIEMAIVESGARRDMGQAEAAIVTLQRLPELRDQRPRPWTARLLFAYADALADAGHLEAAADWFARSAAADEYGETDAAERFAELSGVALDDLADLDDIDIEDSEEAEDSEEGADDDVDAALASDAGDDDAEFADDRITAGDDAEGDDAADDDTRPDDADEDDARDEDVPGPEGEGDGLEVNTAGTETEEVVEDLKAGDIDSIADTAQAPDLGGSRPDGADEEVGRTEPAAGERPAKPEPQARPEEKAEKTAGSAEGEGDGLEVNTAETETEEVVEDLKAGDIDAIADSAARAEPGDGGKPKS